MTTQTVKFIRLLEHAIPFNYSRESDACMDMYAAEERTVWKGQTVKILTGIAVQLPSGFEGVVRGRSGLALKGIHVHIGTVDEEYRGDVSIILSNLSSERPFKITQGMRIAQFTIKPVHRIALEEVMELPNTERGNNGFGSSGYTTNKEAVNDTERNTRLIQ